MKKDKGHELLLGDLYGIYVEATQKKFHDFSENGYASPKMVLMSRINKIAEKIKKGRYDN